MLFHKPAVHGIYAICYLSRQSHDTVVSAAKIAEAMNVPPEQAAKIMQTLQNEGLVTSTRGRSGGYKLAKPLEEITVLQIVDALAASDEEEMLAPRPCPVGNESAACTAHTGMVELRNRVRELLAKETLQTMIGSPCCTPETPADN